MNAAFRWGLCGAVLSLVGCHEITYDVKITNESSVTVDFAITSAADGVPQFISNLGPNSSTTVSHTGTAFLDVDAVKIESGTLIGSQLTPIDATCRARVTDHDLITVVKGPGGQLTCTVTPDTGPPDEDRPPLLPRIR